MVNATLRILTSRAGQTIEVIGDEVYKSNPIFYDQLANQYHWLKFFSANPSIVEVKALQRAGNGGILVMKYIDGNSLDREITENGSRNSIIKIERAIETLYQLHYLLPQNSESLDIDDIDQHYLQKTIARFKASQELIPCLKAEQFYLNGKLVTNPYSIIQQYHTSILNHIYEQSRTGYIHGDPNFSNIIWDKHRACPVLIDPRGAFGKHRYIGDINYDLAKILYSFDGFCDLIEGRGILYGYDARSIDVEVFVHPELTAIANFVIEILNHLYKVSFDYLVLIKSLIYLSAVPLHSHSLFEMCALLERGITNFMQTEFYAKGH